MIFTKYFRWEKKICVNIQSIFVFLFSIFEISKLRIWKHNHSLLHNALKRNEEIIQHH